MYNVYIMRINLMTIRHAVPSLKADVVVGGDSAVAV